jgi:hypothetical protein
MAGHSISDAQTITSGSKVDLDGNIDVELSARSALELRIQVRNGLTKYEKLMKLSTVRKERGNYLGLVLFPSTVQSRRIIPRLCAYFFETPPTKENFSNVAFRETRI